MDVVQPEGQTTWWDITEQVEVSAAGMSPEQLKRLVPPPDRNEQMRSGDKALHRAIADYNPTWINFGMIANGTVSRVEQKGDWEILHFQESADDGFLVCFPASGRLSFRGDGNVVGGLAVMTFPD